MVNLDGSRSPEGVTGFSSSDYTPAITTNPIGAQDITAIISVSLDGSPMPAVTPTNVPGGPGLSTPGLSTFSTAQLSGQASYVSYSSEVLSSADTGVVSLPLSASRKLVGLGSGLSGDSAAFATAAFVRLFAGQGNRVVSVSATRMNDWPKLPAPAEVINRTGASGSIVAQERLTQKEILSDEQEPLKSGNGVMYTSHTRLTYASTVPWAPTQNQSGVAIDELFPVAYNPILQEATRSSIPIRASQQFDPDLYT